MRWSFHLARIAGIDVKIHASFLLLLAYLAIVYHRVGGAPAAAQAIIFVLLVFTCVLLHEFGHALAARRYGIKTPDITLLPIGGVARLERMPEKPSEEIIVALAGPAVNAVIFGLLFLFVRLSDGFPDPDSVHHASSGILQNLLIANLWLGLFNLVPAFPMDGGRVLRALLAMRMNYARATSIAANVGQVMAFGFAFWGLTRTPMHPMLVLIGIFIYFGAGSEAAMAQMRHVSNGMRVSAAMITQFQTLPLSATLNEAIEALLRTSQHEFPVVDELGKVKGILTRDDLIAALRRSGVDTPVADAMRVGIPAVHQSMLFDRAHELMNECGCPALPVLDSLGRLVGLFTPENVGELMLVHSALANAPKSAGVRRPGFAGA